MFVKTQCLITGVNANKDGLEKDNTGKHDLIVSAIMY